MERATNSLPVDGGDCKRNGLGLLLDAINYIEKRDGKRQRESDHGYASSLKFDDEPMKKRFRSGKTGQSRTSHNELEKNRRAHLRNCMDHLKAIVPLGSDSTRHTMLSLLNKATRLIKDMRVEEAKKRQEKDKLVKYNKHLKDMVFRLEIKCGRFRRDSTCSTSLSECSNDSDKDEIIDVMDTSCNSDFIQVLTAANDASSMLMSMPEILIAST